MSILRMSSRGDFFTFMQWKSWGRHHIGMSHDVNCQGLSTVPVRSRVCSASAESRVAWTAP